MIDKTLIQNPKVKNIVFVSEGGLGKVIASTAVVKRLKEEFPEKRIIVVTGYPDIFQYNPHVFKTFNFSNPLYFYDDYINEESFLIKTEPYVAYEYMEQRQHLIDVWCKQIGIERKGAMPEMFFMKNEMESAQLYTDKLSHSGKKKFVLIQWVGGIVPATKDKSSFVDSLNRMHRRSLPFSVAQKLVNKFVSRDFVVGSVQHENFPELQGTERIFFPNQPARSVVLLLKYSRGFVGIDSFLQHASALFMNKGVVCWGGTSPNKLGYEHNINLTKQACPTPFCHRPDSYVFDQNPNMGMWNCPHDSACMNFDADEIIQAYEEIGGKVDAEEERVS